LQASSGRYIPEDKEAIIRTREKNVGVDRMGYEDKHRLEIRKG
jgi:hypothetical protein